ncbi:MAG: hypothetical protein U1F43_31710 [Myxococcota bacterium]
MRTFVGAGGGPGLALALAACVAGCGTFGGFDPPVPMRLPDDDWALGVSTAVVWDESKAIDQGDGLVGVDASWLDGVWGLHAGLRVHGDGLYTRVGGLVEATGWYIVMLGLGTRFGWTTDGAHPATDLTFLVALPIPVWKDCVGRSGSIVVAPYARPGFRLTGNDRDPDDIRGWHEVGITVRWTSYAF